MRRIFPFFLGITLMMTGCGTVQQPQNSQPLPSMALTVLDAGKGDAMLITTPAGSHYMIDVGKKSDLPQILAGLSVKGVDVLSGIILTHGHKDHMGGLEGILEAYPVEEVYVSAIDTVTYKEGKIASLLAGSASRLSYLTTGNTLNLDGITLSVIGPFDADPTNENNNSLVLSLAYGSTTMLLMGDAEAESEAALMVSGKLPKAQLLKLGHHGEDDATSEALLNTVSPQYAVVTADKADEPDAPSDSVLKLLESRGIDYIVTRDDFFACDYTSDGVTITKSVLKQPESKTATNGIIIDSIDRKTEYVRIKNTTGEDADLSGYRLVSENGGETFTFPQGTTLASGQIITIVSGKAEVSGDFVWTEDKVWKNKKADKALLYDAEGTLLSIME